MQVKSISSKQKKQASMKHILLLAVLAFSTVANAQSKYEITVESRKPSGIIDEMLYGQLFEHIYFSANNGVWQELIQERSFEPEQYPGIHPRDGYFDGWFMDDDMVLHSPTRYEQPLKIDSITTCDFDLTMDVNWRSYKLARRSWSGGLMDIRFAIRNKADGVADGAQAFIRVVLPVEQAILAAGGHHAVGLVGALGHQVVNQRADVSVLAVQDEGTFPFQLPRRVHAGDKALHRRLLITGGTVELSRSVEARNLLRFQGRIQFRRVDAVVLDGIGRAGHLRMLQPRHRVQHLQLNFLRHGRREALNIEFFRVQAHRLNEELMPGLVREGHDLCLDAGAVARSHALDDAGVDGTAVQVLPDDLVSFRAGPGQIADRPVFGHRFG